jgi:tetratricopeptide (TPR) repeat protein
MQVATAVPTAIAQGLPDYLARPEFAQLAVLLRHTPRGAFVFALYNTVLARDGVVAALRQLVVPLPVFEYTLHTGQRNPLGYLERLPVELLQRPAVVVIYDLERIDPDRPEANWAWFDTQRENLSAHPHALVFWVTQSGARDAARYAPNTWSQRSGVFDFTVAIQPAVGELRTAAASGPVRIESLDDLERLTRLYAGLLDEYQTDAEAAPALLADLHGKLAYLLYRGDRHAEARAHAQVQLAISRELSDERRQAEALYQIGETERLQSEADAALKSYADALTLFRAVGAKLGEANVLKAIGDVQQFRKEIDAALKSYADALTLFRAVGAKLGEANVLLSLGGVMKGSANLSGARETYSAALRLYAQIGDGYSVARALYRLGDCDMQEKEWAAALERFREAARLWQRIHADGLVQEILAPRIAEAEKQLRGGTP